MLQSSIIHSKFYQQLSLPGDDDSIAITVSLAVQVDSARPR